MAAIVTWRGNEFMQQLKNATAEGLLRATAYLHARCREAVSQPNTGVRSRGKGGRFKKTTYPNPSKPGEPPRLRTGFGQRHILMEFSKELLAGRVGVAKNALYMFLLELGTRRIARRPWLVATLLKFFAMIGRLAAVGGKDKIK